MAHIKFASVEILAFAEVMGAADQGKLQFKRTAGSKSASYFHENVTSIPIEALLKEVANEYDVSADPKDYIFESIRACTAGVANENGDAFSRQELLRFDHRLAKRVYQTFQLKPHQVNHRAENPKTARGVVLDAHYNDSTPAAEICTQKGCGNRTAERENRDAETGLYCNKCGSCVKDEYVEILIAVDAKKDPAFAEGVRTGRLNKGSMGCFLPGTPVTMADGSTKSIELVLPGDRVVTHLGNVAKVDDTSIHQHDGKVHAISVVGLSYPIVATEEHSFWVVNPETGTGSWVPAKDLKVGQYLRTPKIAHDSVPEYTAFARLAGYFVSEGNFIKAYDGPENGNRVGVEFTFASHETAYLDEVHSLLNGLGYDAHRYERPNRGTCTIKSYRCQDLAEKLYKFAGEHAHSKHLSDEVLGWSRDLQLNFLGACLNGDGYHINNDGHSWSHITTVSQDLADQLSQIMTNLGIPNRIAIRKNSSGFGSVRPALDVKITGVAQWELASYTNKIVPTTKKHSAIKTLADSGGLLRKIKANVVSEYTGPVHNFGVDLDDHSYVAGGVAVHNCECTHTTCNVCAHVAYSRPQFCEHIKRGKKKVFKTARGDKQAFEWCGGVVFGEYSRVDQPADPKAQQTEVLRLAASIAHDHSGGLFTEDFVARLAHLERFVAQMTPPLITPSPGAPEQTEPPSKPDGAPASEKTDLKPENLNEVMDLLEEIKDTHPEVHRKLTQILDPGVEGHDRKTIEEFSQEEGMHKRQPSGEAEMGIVPETSPNAAGGASKHDASLNISSGGWLNNITNKDFAMSEKTLHFAQAYVDLESQVTSNGNIRVFSPQGELMVVRPNPKPASAEDRVAMAASVLRSIAQKGVVATAKEFSAILGDKAAQVMEHGIFDNALSGKGGDTHDQMHNHLNDKGGVPDAPKSVLDDHLLDHEDLQDKPPKDTLAEEIHDHAEKPGTAKNTVDGGEDARKEKPSEQFKNTTDDVMLDHKKADVTADVTAESCDCKKPFCKKCNPKKGSKTASPGMLGRELAFGAGFKVKMLALDGTADQLTYSMEVTTPADSGSIGLAPGAGGLRFHVEGDSVSGSTVTPLDGGSPEDNTTNPIDDEVIAGFVDEYLTASGASPEEIAQFHAGTLAVKGGQLASGAPSAPHAGMPPKASQVAPPPTMPMHACSCGKPDCKDCGDKKMATRLEKLYKARFAKLEAEANERVAQAEKNAFDTITAKWEDSLRLAATRQNLNLADCPVKIAFGDVLMNPMDLSAEEVYPGMDGLTAVALVETASQKGIPEFVASLVRDAKELMGMSAESIAVLRKDAERASPAPVPVEVDSAKQADKNMRAAAVDGNMPVAPNRDERAEVPGKHANLRAALSSNKINQHARSFTGR
jgi:intein/homing endonuclease